MKKIVSLALALLMALTACALPTLAEQAPVVKAGVLTMLNLTEEDARSFMQATELLIRQLEKEGYCQSLLADQFGSDRLSHEYEVAYYDNLESMLMALNVGDIDNIDIYESTARYLIANNPELIQSYTIDRTKEMNAFANNAVNGLLSHDFAFMFMEDRAALRDEFDAALQSITEEEKAQLIQEHIEKAITEGVIAPVALPVIEGAETIRVAVTGALPPMDYVAPDGSPAGFNTALLAELSRRMNKNIELVVVDSIGRAAALASGTVEAVFWTRTNRYAERVGQEDQAERDKSTKDFRSSLSDEENAVMDQVIQTFASSRFHSFGRDDMPEGTIITQPYYSDIVVPVRIRDSIGAVK